MVDLIPKKEGGLEKVDVGLGHLYIRHPTTQELRIVKVDSDDAECIHIWFEANKLTVAQERVDLEEAVPNLDEAIRNQIRRGLLPEEMG